MCHGKIAHVFLAIISVVFLIDVAQSVPNYRIIVEAIDMKRQTGPDPYVEMHYIRSAKYNRTHYVVNADATIFKDLPLDATTEVTAFQKQKNNAYSKIPVKLGKGNLCDFIRDDKLFYEDIVSVSNMPRFCPIKAGRYTATDFVVRPDNMPDELPGERWRVDINVRNKQKEEIWVVSVEIFIDREI